MGLNAEASPPPPRDALEGKGPQRRPQKRLDKRLEEVAKAVGGRLLSGTNAIEAGTCRQGDSGWALAGRPGQGGGGCSNASRPPSPTLDSMAPFPAVATGGWRYEPIFADPEMGRLAWRVTHSYLEAPVWS